MAKDVIIWGEREEAPHYGVEWQNFFDVGTYSIVCPMHSVLWHLQLHILDCTVLVPQLCNANIKITDTLVH